MLKFLRYQLILPATALYIYLSGSAPFLGQWDSYDYLKQIVSHQLSPLGFGRPVYLGYNILLWESLRRAFHFGPLKVEAVVMTGTVLLGVLGVVLFHQLARQVLSPVGSRMAALAFAISPIYAVYSGFIMTEVPMLAALVASALVIWKSAGRNPGWGAVAGGVLFGMAVGIREQALCMAPAFLWILWIRRETRQVRIRSVLMFGVCAVLAILFPVLSFYFADPAGFIERTRIWLHAIPMGRIQFWNNLQASLLYTLAVCPASWLAAAAACVFLLFRGRESRAAGNPGSSVSHPMLGGFLSIVLPVIVLWRDADVQIHPRYLMIVMPASLIFCAAVFSRWIRSAKGPVIWAVLHVFVFGIAIVGMSPFRQAQTEKMEFARTVRDSIPGQALLIAGSYSPILDYYRGIGVRPGWRILWSGWDWDPGAAEDVIRKSWDAGIPVYLSEDSLGWRFFEAEYLDVYCFLKDHKKEAVQPKLVRVYP